MNTNKNRRLAAIGNTVGITVKNILESLIRRHPAERFTISTEKFDVVRVVPRTSQGYSGLFGEKIF